MSELCAIKDFLPFILVKVVPRSSAPRVTGNQATRHMAVWVMWELFIIFPGVPKEGESQPSESQGP